MAKKIPELFNYHQDTIIDNYSWMRLTDQQKESTTPDKQTKNVLEFLQNENTHLKNEMADTESFKKDLFDEFVSRIKQDDESVPVTYNGYTYYSKFDNGADYACHYRKKNIDGSKEELILNLPELAKDESYFSLRGKSVSENNKYLAYSTDVVSRREYTIYIKDLETGKILEENLKFRCKIRV